MKKFFIFLIFVFSLFSLNAFSKDLKIGYVDFLKVYDEYKKTRDYQEIIEKKRSQKEEELKKKMQEIEKLQNKVNLLKDKEKEKEKENLEKLEKDFEDTRRKLFLDLKKERDEKLKEILQDIKDVINNYAKKNNFDVILNGEAILFSDSSMDVTSDIMKFLDEKYKK